MIQKPRGTQDIFLTQADKWKQLTTRFVKLLDTYHFSQIITPIFEAKAVFVGGVGNQTDIVQKEMYEFQDRKGRALVLRPEVTAPIVRAVIENKLYASEHLPLKLFYNGPVFRYERPQAGRYRQFNQFGVEIFGNDSIAQDVETLLLAYDMVKTCQLENVIVFELNYLISGASRLQYEQSLRAAILQLPNLCADCQKRQNTNLLRVLDCKIDQDRFQNLPNMYDFLTPTDQARFNTIVKQLEMFKIPTRVNYKLVRGLDYYTGLVFEVIDTTNQQALIAGGRYNDLVSQMGGPQLPAIGFAVGWERVINKMDAQQTWTDVTPLVDAFIIPLTPSACDVANQIMHAARQVGLIVDTNWNITNLKNGFKAADRLKPLALIVIGDKNTTTNSYELKVQATGDTITVTQAELIPQLLQLHKQAKEHKHA